jgi:hypothetical protein
MSLPILGDSCKWNHTVCSLLCLVYFTYHDVLKILLMVAFDTFKISSLLRLNNISLYLYAIFHLFLRMVRDIWVVASFWILLVTLMKLVYKCVWVSAFNFLVYLEVSFFWNGKYFYFKCLTKFLWKTILIQLVYFLLRFYSHSFFFLFNNCVMCGDLYAESC